MRGAAEAAPEGFNCPGTRARSRARSKEGKALNEQWKRRSSAATVVGGVLDSLLLAGCGGGAGQAQVDTHGQMPTQQQEGVQKKLEPVVGRGMTAPNGGVPPGASSNLGR